MASFAVSRRRVRIGNRMTEKPALFHAGARLAPSAKPCTNPARSRAIGPHAAALQLILRRRVLLSVVSDLPGASPATLARASATTRPYN